MAELLLRQPGIQINMQDKYRQTSLHHAVIADNLEVKNYSQIEVT
jgi:ankyrin repeat protein